MENKLPERKATRLHDFDYSSTGAYFITICVRDRMKILSEIVTATKGTMDSESVGEGLAPPANKQFNLSSPNVELQAFSTVGEGLDPPANKQFNLSSPNVELQAFSTVGEGLAPPVIRLTGIGEIVEEQLLALETRYPCVEITDYVIMPDHIHAIIFLKKRREEQAPPLRIIIIAMKP